MVHNDNNEKESYSISRLLDVSSKDGAHPNQLKGESKRLMLNLKEKECLESSVND